MAMHYELSLRDSQATEFAYESLHGLDRVELEPTWNHEPALNGDVDSPHGGSSQKIFPKGFSKPFRHSPEAPATVDCLRHHERAGELLSRPRAGFGGPGRDGEGRRGVRSHDLGASHTWLSRPVRKLGPGCRSGGRSTTTGHETSTPHRDHHPWFPARLEVSALPWEAQHPWTRCLLRSPSSSFCSQAGSTASSRRSSTTCSRRTVSCARSAVAADSGSLTTSGAVWP